MSVRHVLQALKSPLCCREAEAASLGLDTSRQTEDALSVHAPLAVAAWKGKGSINILVSKGKISSACKQTASALVRFESL